MSTSQSTTIRRATAADTAAVERLGQLEGVRPPAGELLVAEVNGELWAAAALGHESTVVADPFRPSGGLTELLRARAEQLRSAEQRTRRYFPFRRRPAWGRP